MIAQIVLFIYGAAILGGAICFLIPKIVDKIFGKWYY